MREIKFRAWNGKAMEYGGFSIHATGCIEPSRGLTKVRHDSPIMQYTGLTDKNGVEIYEEDIISNGSLKGPVVWDEDFYGFTCEQPKMIEILNPSAEVIGNIHENPELLE